MTDIREAEFNAEEVYKLSNIKIKNEYPKKAYLNSAEYYLYVARKRIINAAANGDKRYSFFGGDFNNTGEFATYFSNLGFSIEIKKCSCSKHKCHYDKFIVSWDNISAREEIP